MLNILNIIYLYLICHFLFLHFNRLYRNFCCFLLIIPWHFSLPELYCYSTAIPSLLYLSSVSPPLLYKFLSLCRHNNTYIRLQNLPERFFISFLVLRSLAQSVSRLISASIFYVVFLTVVQFFRWHRFVFLIALTFTYIIPFPFDQLSPKYSPWHLSSGTIGQNAIC